MPAETPLNPPPVVILDRPQLAENIGAVARAMANFGLHELRLVSPRDGWPQDRAWASASGADWPLRDARVFETVADAVADLQLVYACTARPRETHLPVLTSHHGATELRTAVSAGLRCAWLFGAERAGLETMDIALCHGIVTIPIDPKFHSLNLAQAVVVNAYEWWTCAPDAAAPRLTGEAAIADGAMMMGVYEHLEGELDRAGFFFPPEKKPSMQRNLRVALGRARFTEQEARTFRGVITALVRGRGRTFAKSSADPLSSREPDDAEDRRG
ncbi:RNA methyltransferase [Caulobacter sp. S45]|uniref:RNA methyltransferase n=1 Tax=Caulobacter sp. S45 TaxID=1641861 RepID=UPI00157688C5|nr:RNA methyltransferase [Caulobacter sp. S45]